MHLTFLNITSVLTKEEVLYGAMTPFLLGGIFA